MKYITKKLDFSNQTLEEMNLNSKKFYNLIKKRRSVRDFKKDVIDLNPDIVFIYIGINDVWHKYDFGTGSDIDLYENGLRQIISEIQKIGSEVVLCTPTVIGENYGDFTLANQYDEYYRDARTMESMNNDLDAFSDANN